MSANMAPQKEEEAILPHTDARPADVWIPPWGRGAKDLAINVTVGNPLRLDLAVKCVAESGVGLKTVFNTKWHKYGEDCEREGVTFCPFF